MDHREISQVSFSLYYKSYLEVIYLADQQNIPLIKYFVYSDYIRQLAEEFLDKHNISPDNMLAIHLRNGVDFVSYYSSFE